MNDLPRLKQKAFFVMAKPAGPACNLACEYCFCREKSSLFPEGPATRMSEQVLESFIRQYIESQPTAEVTFAWQGGEPTLLGLDFFRKTIELQARYADGRSIRNAFQTNGLLLDDRWADFFAEHHFLVGVSIDGSKELHDIFRRDSAARPTADRVLQAIATLRARGVEFNPLTVVNRRNSQKPLEVYAFLREIGSGFIQFIPLVERLVPRAAGACRGARSGSGGTELVLAGPPGANESGSAMARPGDGVAVAPWSVRPVEYRDFLCTIFDRWMREDVSRVFVQQFEAALAAWSGRGGGLCVFAEYCGTELVLEHNGDLYSCDHYVYPAWRLGNIMDAPLAGLAHSAAQTAFGAAKRDNCVRQCLECEVRFACNGGCPKQRFLRTPDGEPGLNYLCVAYRGFFNHAGPFLQTMADLLGEGRPPALIMERLQADDVRRRLATAGRNDPCPCGSGRKLKHCCGKIGNGSGDSGT